MPSTSTSPTTPAAVIPAIIAAGHSLPAIALGPEFFYRDEPVAVLDALWSVGVRYEHVQAVVARLEAALGMPLSCADPAFTARPALTAADLLAHFPSPQALLAVAQNRQRTSTGAAGILKADVVHQAWERLAVLAPTGLRGAPEDRWAEAELAIRALPGQRSGVSWRYLRMLLGDAEMIKPDRMVLRWLAQVTGHTPEGATAVAWLQAAAPHLGLTPRALDYRIWSAVRALPPTALSAVPEPTSTPPTRRARS